MYLSTDVNDGLSLITSYRKTHWHVYLPAENKHTEERARDPHKSSDPDAIRINHWSRTKLTLRYIMHRLTSGVVYVPMTGS